MPPTIGRIVHYTLSEQDAAALNERRANTHRHEADHRAAADGVQLHVGNPVSEGDVFPMMITRVWAEPAQLVQGQVFLDGTDVLWVTSVAEGTGPRTYAWPTRS